MQCYRSILQYKGEEFTINKGSYYEMIDENGEVYSRGDEYCYRKSNIPQVCLSKSPEGSLFGSITSSNVKKSQKYYIYACQVSPDEDISNSKVGDFNILGEVRINKPSENPIQMEYYSRVNVPKKAFSEVDSCYQEGKFLERKARRIKQKLKNLIDRGSYGKK